MARFASRSSYRPTLRDDRQSSGHPFLAFLFGIVFSAVVLAAAAYAYLHYGHVPVAVADPAFPQEAKIVHIPLDARIHRELEQPPFGTSEDAYESGASLYATHCAFCHGIPGHPSQIGANQYPVSPQLWVKHAHGGVVGVSDDEPGETYWKIRNGIRLTGMPAYQHILSQTQMWQIALLLKNADQPLPDPVLARLAHAQNF